ncbi:hypothetical protein [Neptuniibacter sp. CAU 1671]|uniref:hypothetical protein n=1 Tax=Neptuniibacter sp. CAU 1671 TaxID=3032593 RepID=UPI0023D99350|nr:hypothetical protein [Neptuniibacter sp. CAU 1671]MDF2182080.1 hypothetical protein [Neptuniibacter sp. CAU 1671]
MLLPLWQQAAEVKQAALNSGTLLSLPTTSVDLREGDLNWRVRVLEALRLKAQPATSTEASINPFLPPEPSLVVCEAGPEHLWVLNKYNVFDLHLLLITKTFVPQTRIIEQTDFSALFKAMQAAPALAFYNSGAVAGASQSHKHLQLIPLTPETHLPFTPQFEALHDQVPRQLETLPFQHAALALPNDLFQLPESEGSQYLQQFYDRLRMTLAIEVQDQQIEKPYNLLLTQSWMMLVPRVAESACGISFNALAFTGSLLVKDQIQIKLLQETGLANILQQISG